MTRPFRLGINYWPAASAMGWWPAFDAADCSADFRRIAAAGFDSVRLFLTWEHFQPRAVRVDERMIERLTTALDLAQAAGLSVMPTLFTGHMSGVNWIPGWALGGDAGDPRFRVVSGDRVVQAGLRNWYTDPLVARAQASLAGALASALAGHPALWAWDLGNENSNCVVPPTRALGRDWLRRMSGAIREADDAALVTIGLHMEDLEHDRNLGPAEAAEVCDFLTMHGYPAYAAWSRGPTDEQLLPFLACVTAWLGGGAEVLFSEFGAPTHTRGSESPPTISVDEDDAAAYVARAIEKLSAAGSSGAMLWCYSDYDPRLWQAPPFDLAIHERSFGLWRADASPKPAVQSISGAGPRPRVPMAMDFAWLDIEPAQFYLDPGVHLPRLYLRYCESIGS